MQPFVQKVAFFYLVFIVKLVLIVLVSVLLVFVLLIFILVVLLLFVFIIVHKNHPAFKCSVYTLRGDYSFL